jgi:hypothetical protein
LLCLHYLETDVSTYACRCNEQMKEEISNQTSKGRCFLSLTAPTHPPPHPHTQ